MAYAQELKNLVAEIKTGHKDRTARIGEIKEETHDLIAQYQRELKDIKRDTADLLAQFDKEMKELTADLKEFLSKSEATRMADFRGMMKDIAADIDAIRKAVGTMLTDYKAERKEAARYWASIRGKEEVGEVPAAPIKRGRKNK